MPQRSIFTEPSQPAPGYQQPGELPRPTAGAARVDSIFSTGDENEQLDTSLMFGRKQSPDTAARVQRLQMKTGLPPDAIARDLDAIESAAAQKDFDAERFRRESPILAKWMSVPENAAVGHDDIDNLSTIERALNMGKRSLRSVGAAALRFEQSIYGFGQLAAEAAGAEKAGKFFSEAAAGTKIAAERVRGDMSGAGLVERSIYGGIESVGLMTPGLLASIGTGSPVPMLASIGALTGGEAYHEGRAQGLGIGRSAVYAGTQAAIEVATEKIPAKWLIGDLAKNAGLFRMLVHQGVSDVPGEQVATLLQDFNEWATLKPNAPFSDYLAERPSAAAETLISTLVAAGVTTTMATALDRTTGTSESQRVVEELHKAVEASPLRERSPEALATFIEQAAAEGVTHVYQPVDTFTEYFQAKGESASAVAETLTGDPNAYRFALDTGGDLAIPIASYLTTMTGTGHEAFFAKELRLAPGQANGRETQEQLAATAAETLAAEEEATQPSPTADMRTKLVAQMVAAGEDATVAETVAAFIEQGFPVIAERTGVPLESLMQRWAPEVKAGEETAPASTTPVAEEAVAAQAATSAILEQREDGPTIELLDPDDDTTQVNASGESGASLEALSRQVNMARRGETFVVYGRDGRRRPLIGPDAVDYRAKPGEIVGVETPNGFRLLDNNGGRVPRELFQREPDQSAAFRKWFGESKVVDENGNPLIVYHGTTADFTEFDQEKANPESDFGAGFYFSNTPDDVDSNYAGLGPDLKSKIETAIEQRFDEVAFGDNAEADKAAIAKAMGKPWSELSYEERRTPIRKEVTARFMAHGGLTLPVYLKMENPAVIGDPGESQLTFEEEYEPLSTYDEDEVQELRDEGMEDDEIQRELADRNSYEPSEKGTLIDFIDSLRRVANRFEDADASGAIDAIYEKARDYEGISLRDALDIARADKGLIYATNDEGGLVITELLRQVLEDAGYDGIIDNTVDKKFGSQKRVGQPMEGMNPDTVHYIVFEPTQIKSASGNAGTFDASDPNILRQDEGTLRGSIQFRADAPPVIRLFRAKNRSTFLHEAGHLYLEMMATLAERLEASGETLTPQQQRFVDDYRQVVVPEFGENGNVRTDASHEKWARTFEAYVMEGKAPSERLRVVFARVGRWLTSIYRNLAGLSRAATFHVEHISPDVRGVLDRLLATDDAIAEAQAEVAPTPLFTTAEEAGVDPVEFEGYRTKVQAASDEARARVRARVMTDLTRQETAWWKAERAAVRERMRQEVPNRPVYVALAAIRKGETPDGQPLQLGGRSGPLKLSKAALVADFGADVLGTLPRPHVYADDGVTPAMAAELLGWESGQALVEALQTAPKLATAIESATDAEMLTRHGALALDPSQLAAEAERAVTDEYRDTVVRAELAMLRKLVANAKPSVKAAQQQATARTREGVARLREVPTGPQLRVAVEAQIAGMRLQDIRPDRFLASVRKYGRLATEAAAKGKFDEAVDAKTRELLNLELHRAATQVRTEVEKARTTFDRMWRGDDEARAKRRNMDYVNAARSLAATYFWPDRRAQAALDALELVKVYDPQTFEMLSDDVQAVLAQGTQLSQLTTNGFRNLVRSVDGLWERSRRSQQSLISGQLYQRSQLVEQLVGRLDEIGPVQPPRSKTATGLLGMRAALTRVEHWVTFMDGGNPNGVFRRYVFNPVIEAVNTYRVAKKATLQQYLDLVTTIAPTLVAGEIEASELNYTFASKASLLHALLHTGNESNFTKLLKGRGWEATNWQAFVERMHARGVITEADWRFVQGVWDLHETLKPAAQAAHRELYGTYFAEITARPVVTPFGSFSGGYVPAVLDPFESADGTARVNMEAIEGVHPSMFPAPGFTQKRVEQYAQPLALDLSLLPQHLDKVLRFIHITPRAKEVQRIVTDRSFRQRMHGYDPTVVNDLLTPWLQRAVSQQVTESGTTKGGQAIDRVFKAIRTRTGLNMMAGHVINTLQQFTGIFPAMTKVKPKYLRNALWRYAREHSSFVEHVINSSDFMKTRVTASAIETQQNIEDLLLNPSKYEKLVDYAAKHGYILQTGTQNVIDHITWGGAYEQATERGASHDDAVLEADSAVRETQGSFAAEDLASVEVQRPFMRLFTMFYGYFNTMANLNAYQLGQTARDMGLRKGAGRALYLYTFGFMIPAVLGEAIRRGFTGFDEDDDDEYLDDLMAVFFGSQARTLTAMVPGGSVVTAAVNMFATASPYDDRVSVSPAVTTLESAVRAPKSVYDAIFDDKSLKRAVRDTLALLGLLTGIPAGALARPLGYAADVVEGNVEPENVADAVAGAISGR